MRNIRKRLVPIMLIFAMFTTLFQQGAFVVHAESGPLDQAMAITEMNSAFDASVSAVDVGQTFVAGRDGNMTKV